MAKSDQPPPGEPPGGSPQGKQGKKGQQRTGPMEEPQVALAPYLAIIRRIIRSLQAFFAAHVIVVRTEAGRELVRLAIGAGLVIGALMFLLASAMLVATGLVVAIQRFCGLPWLESLGLSLGATLLVAIVLGSLGLWRIKKPLMPQSRELLKKTLDVLGH